MMRTNIVVFFALVLLSSCKLGKVVIGEDNLFHLDNYPTDGGLTKSASLLDYNAGYINDFKKDNVNNWHGSDKITISRKNGAMVVDAIDVGIEYDRFVCGLHPFRDFSKTGIIKIRAKVIAPSAPVLRCDLKDKLGHGTNHANISMRMVNCDGFVDYYFDFTKKNEQDVPYPHSVDKENISELEFFINPGGDQFTGTILIEEIVAIAPRSLLAAMQKSKSTNACTVPISSGFKNDIKDWGSNSSKYTLSNKDQALCVKVHGAAPGYEAFGKSFLPVDLSKNPILRLRVKAIGKEAPEMRVDLLDVNGAPTNGKEINKTISNDGKYADYYYNFKGKLYEGWPETRAVEGAWISEIMVFINSGGPAFFGEVYISEIEIVKEEIKPKERMTQLVSKKDTSNIPIVSEGQDVSTWWSANKGLRILSENKLLTFQVDQKQENTNSVGVGFNTIDFIKHPALQFKIKAAGQNNVNLKIKLFDADGTSTKAIQLKKELVPNGEFYVFNYDFTGHFSNSNTELGSIDPIHITGINLIIENNDNPFVGKIAVAEITALTLNQLRKTIVK